MFDTHCHLQAEAFNEDRDAVLAESRLAGVTRFMVPATDVGSFVGTLEIAGRNEDVYFGLGIHPHSATEWSPEIREQIREIASHNQKLVAVGEIGLDYHYDFSPRDVQRMAFAGQIELAQELGKPIVIHTRE